jgi:hypothetical protein
VTPLDFAGHWHAGDITVRAAAATGGGGGKNQRSPGPVARGRNQLSTGNP